MLLAAACEADGTQEEEIKWLVETSLRSNALDVIASSPYTRAAFVSLLRASAFPGIRREHATELVGVGGYLVVMRDSSEAPALVVPRAGADLLPLAVVQLVEAGDVIGAGMLVLRATQTHPLLSTSSAAIVALQAYLLRIKNAAHCESPDDAQQGGAVSEGLARRCQAALQAFEEMLATATARS
jgi:hypothetical protein